MPKFIPTESSVLGKVSGLGTVSGLISTTKLNKYLLAESLVYYF